MRSHLLFGMGLLLALSASAQPQGELKARELFYTPVADVNAKAATNEAKLPVQRSKAEGTSPAKQSSPSKVPERQATSNTKNASTSAATSESVGSPLALKYRLLKRSAEGSYDEVDTDTVFRSGDMIRVSVESNDNAYLYIVQQGSSKTWNLLFPNEGTDNGSNRVEPKQEYEIPGGGRFTFDDQAGTERMFIVLSRRPEADLEKLIYSLNEGGATRPASGQPAGEKAKMLMAQNRIDDYLIGRVREKFVARDLVFEKVNDQKPVALPTGARKEKALYVATPDRTPAARIVVDLNLNHR